MIYQIEKPSFNFIIFIIIIMMMIIIIIFFCIPYELLMSYFKIN